MCEFISWIEKNNGILFLDYHDIYETKKGRELQEFCECDDDLFGHGAIRKFYGIKGGVDKECTDFSTTDNFPPEIIGAIKTGKMRHGLPKKIEWLLNEKAIKILRNLHRGSFKSWNKACKALDNADKARSDADKAWSDAGKAWGKAYEAWGKAYEAWGKAGAARGKAYEAWEKAYEAWEKADKVRKKDYEAWEKADKVRKKAYAAWDDAGKAWSEAVLVDFWNLFADVENRQPAWK